MPEALGPFVLHGVLGEGGGGRVYRAGWGEREVALKIPGSASPDEVRRFLREGELLATVAHPSVVRVIDSGLLADGRPFLAMELVEGETLAARLRRGGPLPLERACALLDALASALAAVHARGLVHRDVKPENVMLRSGSDAPVLVDFGIARAAVRSATTTETGIVRGTPSIMAPERLFGRRASVASDVYELAVTFYAALTGALPWDEEASPHERLAPQPVSARGVRVPEALGDAIHAALSTRPERRPGSAPELSERVRAALAASGSTNPEDSCTRDLAARPSEAPVAATRALPAAPASRTVSLALAGTFLVVLIAGARRQTTGSLAAALPLWLEPASASAPPPRLPASSSPPAPPAPRERAMAEPREQASAERAGPGCAVYRALVCSARYVAAEGGRTACRNIEWDLQTRDDRAALEAACEALLPAAEGVIAGHEHPPGAPLAPMPSCEALAALACAEPLDEPKPCNDLRAWLTQRNPFIRATNERFCADNFAAMERGLKAQREQLSRKKP